MALSAAKTANSLGIVRRLHEMVCPLFWMGWVGVDCWHLVWVVWLLCSVVGPAGRRGVELLCRCRWPELMGSA